jgi:hypothetical protein
MERENFCKLVAFDAMGGDFTAPVASFLFKDVVMATV